LVLHTNCFTPEEVKRISEVLKNKFNLASYVKLKDGNPMLYFYAMSTPLFVELVKPYKVDHFKYKLSNRDSLDETSFKKLNNKAVNVYDINMNLLREYRSMSATALDPLNNITIGSLRGI